MILWAINIRWAAPQKNVTGQGKNMPPANPRAISGVTKPLKI